MNKLFAGSLVLVIGMIVTAGIGGFAAEDVTEGNSGDANEQTEMISNAVRNAEAEIRDPFEMQSQPEALRPVAAPMAAPAMEVECQGIGVGPKSAYAILNGEIYQEGEEKGGIKLLAVRKEEAEIMTGGTKRTLKLVPEEDVKYQVEHRAQGGPPAGRY